MHELKHNNSSAMKYALMILALIVIAVGANFFRSWSEEGVSGESTIIGNSFVMAEFGYARGGRVLTYAVIRSFPTNAPDEQRANDPRYSDTDSGVFVRDNDGHMVPVGRDGTVYFFDGDHLRTMKVKVAEDDVGIPSCNSMDEIWAAFQRFEVHNN
jgi:hypothetical protein